LRARFSDQADAGDLELEIDEHGRLRRVQLDRWGNPDGLGYRDIEFGGFVDDEGTFQGYTIPTRLRVGWHVGSGRFESEGEFFRVTIDEAVYR
jgi:hypothetical protein